MTEFSQMVAVGLKCNCIKTFDRISDNTHLREPTASEANQQRYHSLNLVLENSRDGEYLVFFVLSVTA